ncbi:hypothetical protein B0H14DRAFT_3507055 [Mycena olivaceomarginata]|nr:hypothetical protein B0H14DRAFT_3507055 [Mycena olivaceomarginata]
MSRKLSVIREPNLRWPFTRTLRLCVLCVLDRFGLLDNWDGDDARGELSRRCVILRFVIVLLVALVPAGAACAAPNSESLARPVTRIALRVLSIFPDRFLISSSLRGERERGVLATDTRFTHIGTTTTP